MNDRLVREVEFLEEWEEGEEREEGQTYRLQVTADGEGMRLDRFLAGQEELGLSRSRVQQLIEEGLVLVNGVRVKASYRVTAGEEIEVTVPPPVTMELVPEDIPLDIVYEDKEIIVVNKPQGMVVHPAHGHYRGTLVNALLYHCRDLPGLNGVLRPGLVHRLDKDTSGLLVVAKTEAAQRSLTEQIKNREAVRKYRAIVMGEVAEPAGIVDAPIGRHPNDRKKMAVEPRKGRPAVTHYRVLERFKGFTYLELKLQTGRTHQIRVHMAYLGYPVLGDPLYGPRRQPFSLAGQALHAYYLAFRHPADGRWLEFSAPLPEYFARLLDHLRSHYSS